jgi:sortase (surface protein transpeptidase)
LYNRAASQPEAANYMKNLISSFIIFAGVLIGTYTTSLIFPSFSPQNTVASLVVEAQTFQHTPVNLQAPDIGLNANVEAVGKDKQGSMDVPKDINDVGWYKLGPAPGQKGNVVIDGHYDSKTGPAVFTYLSSLAPGNKIIVTDEHGKQYTYVVRSKEVYSDADFPLTKVFGKTNESWLNLITCTGVYDKQAKNYNKRVVVYSQLL